MKKVFFMLLLLISGATAFAQNQQGQSSVGFNLGYHFNDCGNSLLGIDYRYSVTDEFRLAPSISYYTKHNGLSSFALDLNAHYLFPLSDMFGFYPLAGVDLSFWHAGEWDGTRFGVNLGLGGEVYATDQITVGLEAKYNIVKHVDGAILAVRVGYTF